MKKHVFVSLVLGGFLTHEISAQWGGSSSQTNAIYRTGKVEIGPDGGTSPQSPQYQVDVAVGATGDGLRVYQTDATLGEVAVQIDNSSTGGNNWGLSSLNSNSTPSGGHFMITKNGTSNLFINGSSSFVGIGTTAPAEQLHIVSGSATGNSAAGLFASSNAAAGTFIGLKGECHVTGGPVNNQVNIGLLGEASCDGSPADAIGVKGTGVGSQSGDNCFGGYFEGQGATSTFNVGAYGIITGIGAANNAAVYGDANGYTMMANNAFAGLFNGDVFRTGTDNFTSDRNLKENIKPLEDALSTIRQLKPSTYNFKTEQFKGFGLPQGPQIGLIAQDVEEVLPNLVGNVKGWTKHDANGRPVSTIPDFKTIQYISFIPLLVGAIQEQDQVIRSQQTQIDNLLSLLSGGLPNDATELGAPTGFGNFEQNIPNPFTHETLVSYSLNKSVVAGTIEIYDLSGKHIRSIPLSENSGTVTFSSKGLDPGIYIYSVTSDGNPLGFKRMVISGE